MEFESTDLIFRPITEEDTDDVLRLRNSKLVRDNYIHRKEITRSEHLDWLHSKVETGEVIQFVIVSKSDGAIIGSVYVSRINEIDKSGEFGIFIGSDRHIGKGFGTQATEFMVRYFFETMNYHTLRLRVLAHNSAAIKCYKNTGFTQDVSATKRVMIDNAEETVFFMYMKREDYSRRRSQ